MMNFYNENSSNRILELLNSPIIDRCPALTLLFDRCSMKELQDIFPSLINSIFNGINPGGLGWGLRTITKENSPQVYDILYQFFTPLGPMFRLCYRLLNDAVKFDLSVELLPNKLKEVVLTAKYSVFYADLIDINSFKRSAGVLSLNAFDYFLLNFAIHGTIPIHQMHPIALQVHNERSKTAYFFLTAEYLCSFLPSNPDVVVLPTNVCSTVKPPQPLPVPAFQSAQSSNIMGFPGLLHVSNAPQPVGAQESPRTFAWRTESVLNLFVDVWFQFDFNETRELPSSEFVRCVRILVKQLHAFSNSADFDNTPMAILRRQAQPMMRLKIFPFLRGIIARWPLDSSMGVVLELWLSYIQPWRYTFDREIADNSQKPLDLPNSIKFENFICENLPIYTQIFIQILPRFERLDFTSYRNASMLLRIVKVFGQSNLANLLINFEQRRPNTFPSVASPNINSRSSSFYSPHRSGQASDWNSFRYEPVYHDETYIKMFGDSIREQVHQFLNILCIAKMNVLQEIQAINNENVKQNHGLSYIIRMFFELFEEMSPTQIKLKEISRIPNILDFCIQFFAEVFQVEMPQVLMEHVDLREDSYPQLDFSSLSESGSPDLSKISPLQMNKAMKTMKSTIDPALYPIQDMELAWLVRMLHEISCKINDRYSCQIQNLWSRNDIFGKIAKQILYPPMTMRWFQKTNGYNQMREEDVPARICLRTLASIKTLGIIFVIFLLSKLFFSSGTFGLLIFIVAICFYIFVKALIM